MYSNNELYHFFVKKTWQITEDWYESLDKSNSSGVYASNDPEIIKGVKQQNYEFHENFAEVFRKEEGKFSADFEQWILKVAQDQEHSQTPIHFIIREFHRTQKQYLDLMTEFIEEHKDNLAVSEIHTIYQVVTETMANVIEWFTKEYNRNSEKRLHAQQELILELSTPVIALNNQTALLPLVGEIDTARAKILLEKTLEQCNRLGVNRLLLDLSGVVIIDTMVAHQIFQLIEALSLIGVKTDLSGIRPEVAQTAIQLGLKFDNISVNSSLANAIKLANI
ncbi:MULTISPECIES: STAS domain-containing protein [Bacillaceae]|uniref:STAS domain-containing protein n=1 Tax=Bacillaceae TaxID=186817 RepID=UPI001E59F461|nr:MULTISPECIES: STAS domain-containing protein [Bacillaceae]MCE4049319.1 STAS domain-containing protein [Bacillus sp. Au-Bac7]MCM3032340.1 STAS domain-containing protein [Niallia sp. MER 6]